jgi:acyl carrier protein
MTHLTQYSQQDLQTWLVHNLAEQLGITPAEIDIHEPLDSYGLDSAQAMLLMSKAQTLLNFELSPILLWHYPTIADLSERLAEESAESETEVFEI